MVVDTAIERTSPEEGGFGAGFVEDIYKLAGVLRWAVIVGESQNTRLAALTDDNARRCLTFKEVQRVGNGKGGSTSCKKEEVDGGLQE